MQQERGLVKVKKEVVAYKVPSFKITFQTPHIFLSREHLAIGLACMVCLMSISFRTSSVGVTEFTPKDNGVTQIPPIIMEVDETVVAKAGNGNTKPTKVVKSISISDIVTDQKCLNYICHNEIIKRAMNVQKETGLSAVTVIGQKGVESAWGKSSLTKKTNNEGNIKCKCNWNGSLRLAHYNTDVCVRAWDKREKSNHYYVKTKTVWESWAMYKKLITKRYKRAANKTCYKQELDLLQNLGYATITDSKGNKNYSSIISTVIVKYGLDKLQTYLDNGYTITTSNGQYILYEPN